MTKIQDVIRVLGEVPDAVRSGVLGGGIAQRWHEMQTRVEMVERLVRAEDWLEMNKPRFDRSPIRDVRRRLEAALYR